MNDVKILIGVTKILRFEALDSYLKGALFENGQGQCSYFYMHSPFLDVGISLLIARNPPEPNIVTMMMEAACSSETLDETYNTAWCKNPEDHNLCNVYCENLKIHIT
jgi:hypothetical protein